MPDLGLDDTATCDLISPDALHLTGELLTYNVTYLLNQIMQIVEYVSWRERTNQKATQMAGTLPVGGWGITKDIMRPDCRASFHLDPPKTIRIDVEG